jgi:hypothetical protein
MATTGDLELAVDTEWIPPSWVDRQQVPLLNNRIRAARLARLQR